MEINCEDGNGLELCPVVGFGISNAEQLVSATRDLVSVKVKVKGKLFLCFN
jgi:hypothetical protein